MLLTEAFLIKLWAKKTTILQKTEYSLTTNQMYKIYAALMCRRNFCIPSKFVLIMKLTFVLLTAVFLQVGASTKAQQISINKKNTSLKEIFQLIEKQSKFTVVYDSKAIKIAKPISLRVKDTAVETVLQQCLEGQNLDYIISMNTIVIRRKSTATLENKISKVTGKVIDAKGSAIPGVNIRVKGTNKGTTTDAEGKYSIEVAEPTNVLIYTSIGYTVKEITVGNLRTIDVTLTEEVKSLDEQVIIGYGSVNKRDLTGSVSSIKSDEISKSKVTSFQEAIQGKMAGVQISSNSGEPGSGMNISIRGANTIYGSTSPLFVIDGVPYDANANEVGTSSIGTKTASNPLASLNPNDIESIDVLKDASSTAIYGSRGANGVVIITTKSGKLGAPKIDYDGFTSFSTANKKLRVLTPDEYLDYRRIVMPNSILFYTDSNKDGLYNELDEPVDLNTLEKHNWQDETLKTGVSQNHNVSFSAKKDNTSYAGGVGYLDQGAIVRNNDYKRYSARLRVDQDFSEKLKIGFNLSLSQTGLTGASQSGGGDGLFNGIVQNLVISKPIEFYDPIWDRAGAYISPLTMIDDAYKSASTLQNNLSAYLNYKLIPGLSLNISGGGILTNSKTKEFYGKKTSWGVGDNGLGIIQDQKASSLFNTNQLTYEKWINKNNYINAMLATEINQYTYEYFSVQKSNFADESTGIDDISKGTTAKGSSSYKDVNRRISYFGRLNYTLFAKHLFTGTFRADGSDKFGKGKRFGYFPSFAYGWLISEEPFLKSVKEISNLKLRLSYGETGNERIESYRYLARLENAFYNGELGQAPSSSANPDLRWENTIQYNAGIDLGLFNQRVSLTLDVYSKQTKNMLLPVYVPGRTGYNQQWQNIGRVDNKGIEFQITTKNVQSKNFDWETAFNISSNQNEVKNIGNIGYIPVTMGGGWITNVGRVTVGQPIGTAYGYVFDGVYQINEFTWQNNNDPTIPHDKRVYNLKPGGVQVSGVNLRPGSSKFKDLNGDGMVDLDNDRTTISRSTPKFFGGLNNTFRYKNFDVNIFLEGAYGNQIFNESKFRLEGGVFSTWMNINKEFLDNRWTPDNPTNKHGDFSDWNRTATLTSSYYVEDASYLRLKNVSIGYRFNDDLIKSIGLGSARIYVTGTNLYTWTKYTGYDPEIASENALLSGFDRISYPRARVYTIGLNVGF